MSQYHTTDGKNEWIDLKCTANEGQLVINGVEYEWNTHTSKLWIENRLLIDNFTSIYSMNHSPTELKWTRRGYDNTEQFTI